jgi:hypothetical protein
MKKKAEEVRIRALNEDQPGHRYGCKENDPDRREKGKGIPPAAGKDEPQRDNAEGKHDTDQTLGEKSQGARGIEQVQPLSAPFGRGKKAISAPDRRADKKSERHVEDVDPPDSRMIQKRRENGRCIQPRQRVVEEDPHTVGQEDATPGAECCEEAG